MPFDWKPPAAIAVSAAADILSSRGKFELNPVLGRGNFGRRQIMVKVGLNTIPIVIGWGRKGKKWKAVQYGTAAVNAGAVAHNILASRAGQKK